MNTAIQGPNNNCLLDYAITSNPLPLQVTAEGTTPIASSLTIVVSNGTPGYIYCDAITFQLPVGLLAQDLTNDDASIIFSASPASQWQIARTGPGTYLAQPLSPIYNKIGTEGLIFQFMAIQVNSEVGTFGITVTENSSVDNSTFSNYTDTYSLAKFPAGFFVNNFTATTPQINNGQSVTLIWQGSDLGTYTLLYGTQSIDVTNTRTWTSDPLTTDTTFMLSITIQLNEQTLHLYLSTTVIVTDPNLTANILTVNNSTTLMGPVTMGQGLNVTGTITGIGMVPAGSIIMYGGSITYFDNNGTGVVGTAYQGWQLCNGNNGAPDLRNKFITGAGDQYALGNTGGAATVTLQTTEMPAHSHYGNTGTSAPGLNYSGVYYNSKGKSSGIMVNWNSTDPNGNNPNLLTTKGLAEITVDAHSHSIPYDGGGQAHENRPPYYALYYIMKL